MAFPGPFTSGSLQNLQVTLGAAATPVTTTTVMARQVIVQNNAAAQCRVGGSGVSASSGALLAGGNGNPANAGSINLGQFNNYGEIDMSSIFIFGTAGNVIDVIFVI